MYMCICIIVMHIYIYINVYVIYIRINVYMSVFSSSISLPGDDDGVCSAIAEQVES